MTDRKFRQAFILLASASLLLSIISLFISLRAGRASADASSDVQYVVYLGTNTKGTNRPVFPKERAKAELDAILTRHFDGWTVQEAEGGWFDGNEIGHEYTLAIYLSDTELANVHRAADDMLRIFDQSAVLIQRNRTVTEFYSGTSD